MSSSTNYYHGQHNTLYYQPQSSANYNQHQQYHHYRTTQQYHDIEKLDKRDVAHSEITSHDIK